MNRPMSVHSRSFLVLPILGFFAIILSIFPGNAQAASHLPAQAATQAPTQAGTQAPSGPVLDKLNPGESKLGTISAQNTEYRYAIDVKASDQVLAGVTGDEGFTPAMELHAGAADKPGSQLTIGLANPIFGSSLVVNYTFPKDGIYTLVIKPGYAKGSKVGRFVITYGLVTFKKPTNGTAQGDVLPSNGFPIIGTIANTVIRNVYKYDGKQGDKLFLVITGLNGLVPSLSIQKDTYSDDGTPVISQDAPVASTQPQASLTYALPTDGSYYIVVSRAKGTSIGQYIVTLTVNGASVQDELTPPNTFTQPSQMPNKIDTTGDPSVMIGRLRDQGLVPDGGELAANVPANLFIEASTPGLKTLPLNLQEDVSARNFVANVQVSWTQAGDTSACGLAFWSVGSSEFAAALIGNDSAATLLQRSGTTFPIQYILPSTLYTPGKLTTITLIVVGDNVSFYINGQLQTSLQGKSKYGAIQAALGNLGNNTKLTVCNYPSGWVWRF
ncbi:MAG TPA: hypothetical protein VKQ72_09195 [Aggregatilineales bacterium]|nr:hypothetical protein [Aggregatilineales bacterium]